MNTEMIGCESIFLNKMISSYCLLSLHGVGSNTIRLFAIFSLTFFLVAFVRLVRVNYLSHSFPIVERKENLVESIISLPLQPQFISVNCANI